MASATVPLLQVMQTRGIGPRTLARLLERLQQDGMALADFTALETEEMATRFGLTEEQARGVQANEELALRLSEELEQHNICTVTIADPLYPEQLCRLLADKAPPVLFLAGERQLLNSRAVGFCGARDASDESLQYARLLAGALAKRGILVISGHAQRADETAHGAALEAGGTAFVLPEGILHFRPKPSLAGLLENDQFVVVSEFPPKLPWSVSSAMQRNRTICGLVQAMVVIEARTSGGTWEAGQDALRLGVPLFVFDFERPAPSASGNALLMKKGARSLPCRSGALPDLQALYEAIETSESKQLSLF